MLCMYPFVKAQNGEVTRLQTMYDSEARAAATAFPCGRCLHCRINKAREWKNRLLLEETQHDDTCFVTFTFSDDWLPHPGCVDPHTMGNLLKRLRKRTGVKIRYYGVGEYGSKTWRPHYHIALFGVGRNHIKEIEASWPFGFTYVGELNRHSAGYIVGYVTKGLTRPKDTRLKGLSPEFANMSKQDGGIGIGAVKKIIKMYKDDPRRGKEAFRTINHGKTNLPLGRYLTAKLAKGLEIDERILKRDLWLHQENQLDGNLGRGKHYVENLLAASESKRLSQKKKFKIWNQKKESL